MPDAGGDGSNPKLGPNILISGTPGTGKSLLISELIKKGVGMKHIEVSKFALEKNLIEEMDTDRNVPIIDEDAVLDELEPIMARGNNVVEYHSVDFFPKRWFDRVVVLTTDNTRLYNRLLERGYPEEKIKENVQCEIFQVLVEEAHESYDEDVIVVLKSDDESDLLRNVSKVQEFITHFRESNC